MTIKSSGLISFSDINVELGRSASNGINLNESPVRSLLQVGSGLISLSNAYGKSSWKITYSGSEDGGGELVDGAYISASGQESVAVYFSSNVSCTWTITVNHSSRGPTYYSFSPASGQTSTNASFSASTYGNRFNTYGTNVSFSVTVSYAGRSMSFDVFVQADGNNIEGIQ